MPQPEDEPKDQELDEVVAAIDEPELEGALRELVVDAETRRYDTETDERTQREGALERGSSAKQRGERSSPFLLIVNCLFVHCADSLDRSVSYWYLSLTRYLRANMSNDSKLAPIRKGLLEFLVLKIVGSRSVYVPDILRRLADTEFATQEGTLYPLLSKLRREDLVQYEWQESDAGPPRKYYRLTDAGKAQLASLDEYWNRINRTIAEIGQH
jgi:PadR family transcriptional regulator, regulatory protein PadR